MTVQTHSARIPRQPRSKSPQTGTAADMTDAPERIGREIAVVLAAWIPLALAFYGITTIDISPLRNRAVMLPLVALIGAAAVAGLVWRRWKPWWLPAASAGYLAAWVVLMLRAALQGTPVAFGGHTGDAGRLAALATRYSVTWWPADAFVPGITGEYPPLLPWIAGRLAALQGVLGWQLVGDLEFVFSSASVVAGFLLWRRIVGPWTAFAIAILVVAMGFSPPKAFSAISLVVFLPLVLATLARPDRGRLHWFPAGIIMGLMMLSYWGFLVLAGLGLVACLVIAWRAESDRWAYVTYLAKIAATALAVSSWFVIPLVHGMFTNWGPSTGDTYGQPGQHHGLFYFLDFNVMGVLQLIGLVGLIWLRSTWWAKPLLALAIGSYVFRFLAMSYFFLTNHSLLFYYTDRVYTAVFAAGGVLVLAHVLLRLVAWDTRVAELTALAVGVFAVWLGWGMTHAWMPGTSGPASGVAKAAYAEPLADGRYTINGLRLPLEERSRWYPVSLIEAAVARVHGPDARPITLSYHESLYVYLPWPGYLPVDRGAAANGVRWDERFGELSRLSELTDPAAFATASSATRFGRIDVFVLRRDGDAWTWSAHIAHNMPAQTVKFAPAQFDLAQWDVTDLPNDYVVAVRK